jgi:hypothetical protein
MNYLLVKRNTLNQCFFCRPNMYINSLCNYSKNKSNFFHVSISIIIFLVLVLDDEEVD